MDLRDNAPLIAAGGGLLLFISLFLKWFGAEGVESVTGWEVFSLMDIVLAAIGLSVAAIGVMLWTGNTTSLPAEPASIVTTAGLIAFGIVVANAIDPFEGIDAKFGVWLALIATIAIIVGGTQLARGGAGTVRRTGAEPPPPPPPANPAV